MREGVEGLHVERDDGFEAMYRREIVPLVALATSMIGSREAGHDLAHETMLRTYRAWPSVRGMDRPGAWSRRVLINLAIDHHRRARRERSALARLAVAPVYDDPTVDRFWSLVRSLPDRQRAVVALRHVDDWSVEQIADVLEVSAGTVKSSLHRAHRTIEAALAAEETR